MENPVPLNHSSLKPIKIENIDLEVGTKCKLSGWGLTHLRDKALPELLQVGESKVMSNENCRKVYNPEPERTVCTGGVGTASDCMVGYHEFCINID